MTELLLDVKNLSKAYGGAAVLKGNGLTLKPGVFTALMGRNGSGKTTLLNVLAQHEQPDAGEFQLAAGARVGFLSSEQQLPSYYTVAGLARMHTACCEYWQPERWQHVVEAFGLDTAKRYGALSTGQRAGVKLGLFLAQGFNVWLLDEVTNGLDLVARDACVSLLLHYFTETKPAVLFCTHLAHEVEQLADEIYLMSDGVLTLQSDDLQSSAWQEPLAQWLAQQMNKEGVSHV